MINQLPDHFMDFEGGLYDTRRVNWSTEPLRPVYSRHFREIDNTQQFKASLRAGGHTYPGGYSLAFTTEDGCILCFDCAEKEARLIMDSIRRDIRDGWHVDGIINADDCDDGITCDHCSAAISEPFNAEEL